MSHEAWTVVGHGDHLAGGVRAGNVEAVAAYYDRYERPVRALLSRLLGSDDELEDLHHEVFVRALESIGSLRDDVALGSWTLGIAAQVARIRIQSKQRRWWLHFAPREELPEIPVDAWDEGTRRALRAAQRFILSLPSDERIAFVFRCVEGMTLPEAAATAGTSLATLKRRLAKAQKRLDDALADEPELEAWLADRTEVVDER